MDQSFSFRLAGAKYLFGGRNKADYSYDIGLVIFVDKLIIFFSLSVALTAVFGWYFRNKIEMTPEHGAGYLLGIVGTVLILAVGLYSARKRSGYFRWLGSNSLWFRAHILLGLVGPTVILFHARFAVQATNSGVALGAMLGVAGSGLIGWFIYRHIYRGYSQYRLDVTELLADVVRSRAIVDDDGDPGPSAAADLMALATAAGDARGPLLFGLLGYLRLDFRTRLLGLRLGHRLRHNRPAVQHLATYLQAVRAAAGFAWYERLFGLWHLFHVPLFFFLIVTATIHVIAVHRY